MWEYVLFSFESSIVALYHWVKGWAIIFMWDDDGVVLCVVVLLLALEKRLRRYLLISHELYCLLGWREVKFEKSFLFREVNVNKRLVLLLLLAIPNDSIFCILDLPWKSRERGVNLRARLRRTAFSALALSELGYQKQWGISQGLLVQSIL